MRFVPLALLCVTVCYCRYYEGASQNTLNPQQAEDSQRKGQHIAGQQVVQIPQLPPLRKRCRGAPVLPGNVKCTANMKRYTYNEYKDKCVKITYGGCREAPNNFKTRKECERTCVKRHPYYHS
ncbi:Kunitz/Bovine pancreatic trypsin inhibitor domain protein [Ancylostoma ceylanicum]|uniref:Kunitz/Bovine pancreatic trypsin inhibitor domain protein n=2 Tax=Ancylostoma ceylanicum TaxID=53326 RepID=A0A0D6L8Y0_9BILA|nr:Kunitz/Bovine pancreatic trypsin inhibitor domain protein [Ancylostoma ceylanicum]EYC17031.1 hypothetical protein Y032_0031g2239 [Ancylostoma ceylanicum]